jgi:Sulfotransferase domain
MKQQLDFIVIGAQKSGTTSLFEYMRRHPDLCLPAAKEVPYFSHDANYGRDWAEYLRKAFPFADPDRKWGTVTPHYMYGGIHDATGQSDGSPTESDERTVPLRIRDRLPDVRLIAILRDPVQRARSHHAMAALNGWDPRPFSQAVQELLEPDALVSARRMPDETTGYVVWGEYGRILAGYLQTFAPEQLLVLFTSELRDEPESVLRRVFKFLGVDDRFVPDNLGTNYREGGASRRFRWLDLNLVQAGASSNSLARRLWHALPEPARRRVDRRFDRINYLVGLWNRRSTPPGPEHEAEADLALREHYAHDSARLAELLGVAPPWTSEPTSTVPAAGPTGGGAS